MDYVRVCKSDGDEIMDMGREASKTCLIAHEAMDVNEE